ncbi:MAG: N-acetylmuramoyl-L-alanine amidase [Alphaproteobacteria bacterium]|nr:N-acetylmuramoyl-L-alanine amidase [Alphaproteobacteria bacterium]
MTSLPPERKTRRLFLRAALGLAGLSITLALPRELLAATRIVASTQVLPLPPHKPVAPRLLMIDPGHGGRDPGAIGRSGTLEKDITLDIGRRLVEQLAAQRHIVAKLTRDSDTFLPLADRVAAARSARADFLVSIHADSAPNASARGLSAYTLSKNASDDFAKALAAQENLADAAGGLPPVGDEDVTAILMDLTARHTRNAAQRAKVSLIDGIGKDWKLLENPMRAANFAVLRAPDVPSILIETGFLSNAKDEAILKQPEMREKIAALLARELAPVLARTAG